MAKVAALIKIPSLKDRPVLLPAVPMPLIREPPLFVPSLRYGTQRCFFQSTQPIGGIDTAGHLGGAPSVRCPPGRSQGPSARGQGGLSLLKKNTTTCPPIGLLDPGQIGRKRKGPPISILHSLGGRNFFAPQFWCYLYSPYVVPVVSSAGGTALFFAKSGTP